MGNSSLPKEIISLIHHIELNKAGWWDASIQRIIIAVLWLATKNLTMKEIADELNKKFYINPGISKIKTQVDALCSSGILLLLPNGEFKISEMSLKEFEQSLKKTEEIEYKAKYKFIELLKKCCPTIEEPEKTWDLFNGKLLVPLVREMGARTYELFSGVKIDLDTIASFTEFLRHYPKELHQPLRNTVIYFLDPKNSIIRTYILLYLNSYFFLEAGNLNKESLEKLSSMTSQKPLFIIFLDTNFLFSLLELHDNSSNEAARALLELIKYLQEYVEVKLYVLPLTINETKRVLTWHEEMLKNIYLSKNLAKIAIESNGDLDDITLKFINESEKSGHTIKAKDYFDPYLKNLLDILKSKKIQLWNEKLDKYTMDSEVIDDISDQMEFEKRRYPRRKKSYEQLLHDVAIWHVIKDKRSVIVESPLDAKYWFITIDYRLLGFDSFKRNRLSSSIPLCILPTTLLQMLQLWVPRTPETEEAILSSLRLSFLFHEFDPASEAMTIRILGLLSRFENINDLHPEMIKKLLIDDALRQKLSLEPDEEKQIEFVREALIEENKRIGNDLKVAQEEVKNKTYTIAELENEMGLQKTKIKEYKYELQKEKNTQKLLQEQIEAHEKRIEELEDLKNKLQKKEDQENIYNQKRLFVTKYILILALFLFGALGLSLLQKDFVDFKRFVIGALCVISLLWIYLIDLKGSKDNFIKEWNLFIIFRKFKNWLFGILLSGLLVNALWEILKNSISRK